MATVCGSLHAVCDLEWHQLNQSFSEEPLFQSWPTQLFGKTFSMFRLETVKTSTNTIILKSFPGRMGLENWRSWSVCVLCNCCRWEVSGITWDVPEGAVSEGDGGPECGTCRHQTASHVLYSIVAPWTVHWRQGSLGAWESAERNRTQVVQAAMLPFRWQCYQVLLLCAVDGILVGCPTVTHC